MFAKAAVTFVFLCACLLGLARGELLQRLHVLDFKVTSDTARPRAGVPFHVTLTIHVRERVPQLQYVYLPALPALQNLVDRRSLRHVRGDGSIYRETLTLVANKPGPIAIGSAYLDAVDLRDGKTKRFISNDLILNVTGSPTPAAQRTLRNILPAVLALLLLAAAVFAALRMFRRRPLAATADGTLQAAVPPAAPPIGLDEALASLRTQRDRSSVLRVREALWSIAGASRGETLAQVLQREPARAGAVRAILIAIEHAAFVHDARLQKAIDDALAHGEHRIAR